MTADRWNGGVLPYAQMGYLPPLVRGRRLSQDECRGVWMLGTSRPLAAHTFAACTCVCPGVIWAALTDPDQTAAFLYGLAAHSTWVPGAPIAFRHGNGVGLTGRVLHARRNERLSYLLQSGPDDPPVYLTWLLRPTPGGCTIRLEIDEVDSADSAEDAEDVWLPVLAALQDLVSPG